MNVSNVETLNLNDSRVDGITIRSGEICFNLRYIEDYDSCAISTRLLVFRGCRTVTISINLNVEWPDSILQATETCDGEWRNIVLEMNTSGSVFNISGLAVQLDAGNRIMGNKVLGDPRYSGMEKWQHVHVQPDGTKIVIHFIVDPQTGVRTDFKFK